MTVIVFEGFVRVCNLAGVCVVVKAGQTTTVRNGDSSGPAVPAQALLGTLTDAVNSTNLGDGLGLEPVHHTERGTAHHHRDPRCWFPIDRDSRGGSPRLEWLRPRAESHLRFQMSRQCP